MSEVGDKAQETVEFWKGTYHPGVHDVIDKLAKLLDEVTNG